MHYTKLEVAPVVRNGLLSEYADQNYHSSEKGAYAHHIDNILNQIDHNYPLL